MMMNSNNDDSDELVDNEVSGTLHLFMYKRHISFIA